MGATHSIAVRVIRLGKSGQLDDIVVEDNLRSFELEHARDQLVVAVANKQGQRSAFALGGAGLQAYVTEVFTAEDIRTSIKVYPQDNVDAQPAITSVCCQGNMWMLRLEAMGETSWWGSIYTDDGSDRLNFFVNADEPIECVNTSWPY